MVILLGWHKSHCTPVGACLASSPAWLTLRRSALQRLVRRHGCGVAVTPFDLVPSSWIVCAALKQTSFGGFDGSRWVRPMRRHPLAEDRKIRDGMDPEGHSPKASCTSSRGLQVRHRWAFPKAVLAEESRMRRAKRPLQEQQTDYPFGVSPRIERFASSSPAHA
jgi:hypothetical protein